MRIDLDHLNHWAEDLFHKLTDYNDRNEDVPPHILDEVILLLGLVACLRESDK